MHAANRQTGCLVLLLIFLPATIAAAGEIPGLPANLPPSRVPALDFGFYNDFLGRGGSIDDFRTQQLLLTTRLGGRWSLIVDNSILTQQATPGRVDQISASLGYELFNRRASDLSQRILVGGGLRVHENFGGERIQNGFHQLIGGELEFLPYERGEGNSGVAWIDAQHQRKVWKGRQGRAGYWLRGSALATSDGQFDSSLGIYATFETQHLEVWTGLRQDWRRGYETPVMAAVANAESDGAAVLGLRWGALVLETVQQFNNDASYGSLRLVSVPTAQRTSADNAPGLALELGFLLPDVQFVVAGRWQPSWLNRGGGSPQTSLATRLSYGKPQFGDENTLYVETQEINVGIDWEVPLSMSRLQSGLYASAGIGVRSEQAFGEGDRLGQAAGSASGALLQLGTGIRMTLAETARQWRLRLQLGVNVSAPFEAETRDIGDESRELLETTVTASVSVAIEHR